MTDPSPYILTAGARIPLAFVPLVFAGDMATVTFADPHLIPVGPATICMDGAELQSGGGWSIAVEVIGQEGRVVHIRKVKV